MRTRLAAAVVAGLLLAVGAASARTGSAAADCSRAATGFTPLTDLGTKTYRGHRGGLYANGRNRPPAAYAKTGLAHAAQVQPRGVDGRLDASGSIVLLSIGMSNTTQEFSAFRELAAGDPRRSDQVVVVDGAQGGQDAERIRDGSAPYWQVVESRLTAAGVTARQVQVAWVKQAFARPTDPFPAHAARLRDALRDIVGVLRTRFPNLRLIYVSSRTYAGYATTALNPEPYAFESGFAVRWLVQQRIDRKLRGPWIGWGALPVDGRHTRSGRRPRLDVRRRRPGRHAPVAHRPREGGPAPAALLHGRSHGAAVVHGLGLALAHEALARGGHERHGFGEQHAHRIPERDRLLVHRPGDLQLPERRRGEVDRRVQRQRRELLALRLGDGLGLLLGELAQPAQHILRIAAEGKAEAA